MAGLPILILLFAATLLWIMRRSHIRMLWMVTVAGVFGSWLSSLILTYALPLQINFLRGQTDNSNAFLKLDSISWPFVLVLTALLLSSLLSTFAKRDDFAWKLAFQFLFVGAAGLAAAMAGNVLSFVLTWAVLDLTMLAIRLNTSRDEFERIQAIKNFGLRATASILLMTAEFMNLHSAGTEDLTDISTMAVFGLIFLTVLLRSVKFGDYRLSGEQQPSTRAIHSIMSTAAGFSLLARVLSSPLNPTILDELRIAGAVFAGCAIAILLINADLRLKSVDLGLICLSIVLLMEAHSTHFPGRIATSISVLLILSTGASQIQKPSRTWYVLIVGAIALMFIGMPGTFGSVLAESATIIIQGQDRLGLWVLAPIVLILYGARRILEGLDSAKKFETPVKKPSMQTTFAMLLLPFSGFATLLVERQIKLEGVPLFATMAGVMLISVFALSRLKVSPIAKLNYDTISGSLRPAQREIFRLIQQVIRGSAVLFEGESGMLWVYVILLFLFVAFGGSS